MTDLVAIIRGYATHDGRSEEEVRTMMEVFLPACRPGSWSSEELKELFDHLRAWSGHAMHGKMLGPQ